MTMKLNISTLIKQKRSFLKESQTEFGKRFGVSHVAVSDWERGVTKMFPEPLILFLFSINYESGDITESDFINYGYNKALEDISATITLLSKN